MIRSAELPDAGKNTTRKHAGALTWPQSDARPRLPSDVRALFPKSAVRTYGRGETVTGGGLSDGFTILLEGRAKLTMQDPDGRQVTLGVVGAGEIVAAGESRFHGGIALTAVAHPMCRVLHVTVSDMLSAMQADRGVASLVVRALCAGLADARSRIASLAFRGVRARVAGTPARVCERRGRRVGGGGRLGGDRTQGRSVARDGDPGATTIRPVGPHTQAGARYGNPGRRRPQGGSR